MKDDQSEPLKEFIFVEYHEAANAYFSGVEIGYTTVKHYTTINGLLVALLGILAGPGGEIVAAGNGMAKYVPWFALVISIALLASLRHYFRHLENCRKRCQEIERLYGGKLFTSLGKIAHRKHSFHTGVGLLVIIGLIVVFWIWLATEMQSPGFQILALVTQA